VDFPAHLGGFVTARKQKLNSGEQKCLKRERSREAERDFSFLFTLISIHIRLPCPFFCSVQTQWILGWRSNEGTSSGCCFMTKSVPGSPAKASDTPGPLCRRGQSAALLDTRVPPASKASKPPSPAPCRQTPNSSRRNIRISVPRLHLQRPSIAATASPSPSPSPSSIQIRLHRLLQLQLQHSRAPRTPFPARGQAMAC
jgi:hypothetical protein